MGSEKREDLDTLLSQEIQNLEEKRKILHEAVDHYVNAVITTGKTYLQQAERRRESFDYVRELLEKNACFLGQKEDEICSAAEQIPRLSFSKTDGKQMQAGLKNCHEVGDDTDEDIDLIPPMYKSQQIPHLRRRSGRLLAYEKEKVKGECDELQTPQGVKGDHPEIKCRKRKTCSAKKNKKTEEEQMVVKDEVEEKSETGLKIVETATSNTEDKTNKGIKGRMSEARKLKVETPSGNKDFSCDVCQKNFKSSPQLSAHRRGHFYELSYKCTRCGRGYPFRSQYNLHMLTHTGEKPHKCETCNKSFQLRSQLTQHKKIHLGHKPIYHCDLCEKSFTRKFNLHKHQRIHLDNNPYRCHICGHNFTASSDLHRHIMLHTGERPFRCDTCDEGFTRKRYLTRHMRKHTGERPYRCSQCGKGFTSKATMDVHIQTHRADRPWLCDHCGKGFKIQSSLYAHKRSHIEGKPYRCELCNKYYKDSYLLSVHKRTHKAEKPFTCPKCGKCFREKCQLAAHEDTHTEERPHVCGVCGKGFKKEIQLNRHKEIHTEGRPYKCDVCGKGFKVKYAMSVHRKKMHDRKGRDRQEGKVISKYCKGENDQIYIREPTRQVVQGGQSKYNQQQQSNENSQRTKWHESETPQTKYESNRQETLHGRPEVNERQDLFVQMESTSLVQDQRQTDSTMQQQNKRLDHHHHHQASYAQEYHSKEMSVLPLTGIAYSTQNMSVVVSVKNMSFTAESQSKNVNATLNVKNHTGNYLSKNGSANFHTKHTAVDFQVQPVPGVNQLQTELGPSYFSLPPALPLPWNDAEHTG